MSTGDGIVSQKCKNRQMAELVQTYLLVLEEKYV
jgi:hypothetical protein